MGILFIDPFDQYATTAQMHSRYNFNNGNFLASSGRFGGGALQFTADDSPLDALIPSSKTIYVNLATNVTLGLNDDTFLQLIEGTVIHLTIMRRNNGDLEVRRGATTVIGLAQGVWSPNKWQSFEMKATIDDTEGEVIIFLDDHDTPVINISLTEGVDTRNGGTLGEVDTVRMIGDNGTSLNDDLLVRDTLGRFGDQFLGDVRLYTKFPTGDVQTEFDPLNSGGEHYLEVDEPAADEDTSYVEQGVAGLRDRHSFDALAVVPKSIYAVGMMAHAKKTDAGGRSLGLGIEQAGNLEKVDHPLSTSYAYYDSMFEEDPSNTGGDWTLAGMNGVRSYLEVV